MSKEPMEASVILILDDDIISLFLAAKLSIKLDFFQRTIIKDANSISDDLVAAQKQLASISGCIATSHNEKKKGRPVNYKFSYSAAYTYKFLLARDGRFHPGVVFYFFGLRALSNEMVKCVHLLIHHPFSVSFTVLTVLVTLYHYFLFYIGFHIFHIVKIEIIILGYHLLKDFTVQYDNL
ncbi:unnamed protein product [Brugia pahangi]|uniref:Uncharacterized protein n=1 Tax=Brugia pahangi TaxID=6280 RepID=A0A0N4TXE2_BRUPA|nr:unnamed protein product [Brugia pahangi]